MPLHRPLLRSLLLAGALPLGASAAVAPLAFVEAHFHVDASFDGLHGAVAAAVSPDGKSVYVLGKGDDAVSEWARDPATGALAYLGRELGNNQTGGTVPDFDRPEVVAVSPDGKHVYIATVNTDPAQVPPTHSGIAIFTRDLDTGALSYTASFLDGTDGASLQKPAGIAVSADGAFVYVSDFRNSLLEGAVDVFSRDASTGLLARVQTLTHVEPTLDGLGRAHGLALSPDGAQLYVTSHGTSGSAAALAAFARDAMSGQLAFVAAYQHGAGGVSGLGDPYAARVSPDGAFLYVASYTRASPTIAGSVDVFQRDGSTGELTPVTSYLETEIGFVGPDSIALSPDGARVYVAAQGTLGSYDSKLAVFWRAAGSGALARLDLIADDANGVDGLKGALDVAVSPDGQNVYVCAEQDAPPLSTQTERGAVGVFRAAPEPAPAAAALAALAALGGLAQRSASSQSRGRRNTS